MIENIIVVVDVESLLFEITKCIHVQDIHDE